MIQKIIIIVDHLAIRARDLKTVMSYMKEIEELILNDIYELTQGIREVIVQRPWVQFVE